MQATARATRTLPTSRRLMATVPTGRPAAPAPAGTTNLGAQQTAGYGGSQGPLPQAGGKAGKGPQPPKKSNVGVIVGTLALVGGAATYYLTQESDPAAAAKSDLHRLEAGAKHEIDALRSGARSDSAALGPQPGSGVREVERGVDALRSPDDRYGAEQLRNAVSSDASGFKKEVSRWGDALEPSASQEKRAFSGVTDEVKAWGDALSSGPNEGKAWKPALEEVKRYRDMLKGKGDYGVAEVERYLHGAGLPSHNITEGGNVWLDWIGGGGRIRKNAAARKLDQLEKEGSSAAHSAASTLESKYYSAKSAVQDAASDVKDDARGWLAWGEKKGEQAQRDAKAEYEKTKSAAEKEASSWSSWTSSKASDAASAAKSAAHQVESSAASAYNQTTAAAQSAYNSTASTAQGAYNAAAGKAGEAEKKAEQEAKGWLSWGSAKTEDAKDGLKSGLLSAEKGVEHGAQKAQDETKKL